MRQYDPKLMRARSRFEGVRTPRNEGHRRLPTKPSLEQTSRTVHPNVTEVYVLIIHMMLGKDGPRQTKIGQTYNGLANRYYQQSRKQRGGRLLK